MAEQRALARSVNQADLFGGLSSGEERPVNKTSTPEIDSEVGQSISESATLDLKLSGVRSAPKGREKGKVVPIPAADGDNYRTFRRLCDDIIVELKKIGPFMAGDEVSDEGAEVIVEVEELIERLYDCPW